MSADTLTHALTVHQPYAWALAAGHKPVENRTWRPPVEMVGKLMGIHAGKEWHGVTAGSWSPAVAPPLAKDRTLGALIGVARLVGVVKKSLLPGYFSKVLGKSGHVSERLPDDLCERIRPWWRGPWGWLLEEAVLLPEPIPMRGQQGLWRIPPRVGEIGVDRMVYVWPAELALEQWRKAREVVR